MMLSTDIQSHFGLAIRVRRKGLGISQEELAGRAGLHRTYVADVERGARNLSLGSIDKLAHGLEVSIASLFSESASTVHPPPEGMVHILLVEDDPADAKLILDVFRTANLSNPIHTARDGVEALEYIFGAGHPERPHKTPNRSQLILLDLSLPKVSGLEVLRRIKGTKETKSIPVVVLISSQRQPDLTESLRLGAATFLVKPVDFNRFAGMSSQLKLCWALLRPPARSST